MLVVWDSLTGNVERFVEKLEMKNVRIHNSLMVEEPFILVTYTTGFGRIPKKVSEFLQTNHLLLLGVVSSGNRNWGFNFGKAADEISQQYGVPIIHKFELSGTDQDVETFKERLRQISGR